MVFPTTLPWGFEFIRSREWQELYNQGGVAQACHPTQIYEMLYCITALAVSWFMYHKMHLQQRIGLITGVSLLIFFGSRFALEFMKNPQVAEEVGMTFNIGQWLSVPLILLGFYLILPARNVRRLFKFRIIFEKIADGQELQVGICLQFLPVLFQEDYVKSVGKRCRKSFSLQ